MELIGVAAIVVLAGFTQTAFGFGFALIFTPLDSFVVGPHTAVATTILLSPLFSLFVYWEHRPREPLRAVMPLALPSFVGLPLGLLLLVHVNEPVLRVLVGGAVALGAGMNLHQSGGEHPERPNRVLFMVPMGLLGGLLRGSTGMGGPPVVLYEHWVGGEAAAIRRRLFAYFALFALPTIPMAMVSGVLTIAVWKFALVALPASAVGFRLGRGIRPRLSEVTFRRLSMLLLAVTAGVAVLGAALALI